MKKLLFVLGFVVVFGLLALSAAPALANCSAGHCATMVSAGGNGQPAVVSVTNSGSTEWNPTFRSYKEFVQRYSAGWLSTQVLFDTHTVTVEPGQTVQISVNNASCKMQSDLFDNNAVVTWNKAGCNDDQNPNVSACYSEYPILAAAESNDSQLCSNCQPKNCSQLNYQCGSVGDGCGNTLNCGNCSGNQTCQNGQCITTCQPKTCSQLNMECGSVYDGCNGNINCGSCSGNQTCQNGHCVTNCQPRTCAQAGYQCGTINDGCGNTLNCGNCSGNQTCQNGQCITNCSNQCSLGDRRCSGNGYQVCGNYDGNGCSVWGQTIYCANNQSCENGYCNRIQQNLSINLYANPSSGCAPLDNVGLHATVNGNYGYNSNYGQNQFTYYFDCNSDGSWDKTVTTGDTDVIVNDLCDYENPGNYTARVRVESDGVWANASTVIEAQNCNHYQPIIVPKTLSIQKTVADLSNGTGYQPAVTASAGDTVSFRIAVGSNSACQAVIVNDIIPAGIENIRDLRVDGIPANGNILSGIAIGNLANGQQRIITFTATVDGPAYFPYGQTTLTDTATARNNDLSNSSSASVYVWRQAVLGATKVSTGITDSPWFEYFAAGIIGLTIALALFRKEMAKFIASHITTKQKRLDRSEAELKKVILKLQADDR